MTYLRAVMWIASCWLLAECALTVRHARWAADELLMLADDHAAEIERRADERIAEAIALLDRRLDSIEQRADRRLAAALHSADSRLGEALFRADARLIEALHEVRELRHETQATVMEARAIVADARPGVQTWASLSPHLAANALGAMAAAKVTAGQAAQTMREIERATPDIVASIEASALASQRAAQAAAQTASNLAQITRPGPRWLRYLGLGLGVAAPASQVALPFILRKAELQ